LGVPRSLRTKRRTISLILKQVCGADRKSKRVPVNERLRTGSCWASLGMTLRGVGWLLYVLLRGGGTREEEEVGEAKARVRKLRKGNKAIKINRETEGLS